VSSGDTADWIGMPFGVVSGVGLSMGVLDFGGDRRTGRGSLGLIPVMLSPRGQAGLEAKILSSACPRTFHFVLGKMCAKVIFDIWAQWRASLSVTIW